MYFDVTADAYARFMGRYSQPLARAFVDTLRTATGARVLDVGCGPGALTAELVNRFGAESVAAMDPTAAFVEAVRARWPGVAVEQGSAENLPYADGSFGLVAAQLVVHFMSDPVAGLAEMARVVAPGGTVAATVWDHSGERGPLSLFWRAVRDIDPAAPGESHLAGVAEGELADLFERAGMPAATTTVLTVPVVHPTFEEWWEPYELGIGPAGAHVSRLDDTGRAQLRARCRELLPAAPFTIEATTWSVSWVRPSS